MNGKERALLVDALGSAISDGEQSLGQVPALLIRTLKEGIWQDFETRLGESVHHNSFADFVAAPPLRGLGAEMYLLRKIVAGNAEAVNLLDQAVQRPAGRPEETVSIIHNSERPAGTTEARAHRKLRKDRPDLHAQVLAGEKTAHAAMVEAGFRHPTATVPTDDMERLAAALRRNLDPAQLDTLTKLLTER